jgi:hypothetical protein
MLAERRKLSAMRISSGVVLGLMLMVCAGGAAASQPARDEPAHAMLERGLSAYKTGAYNAALPALKEAAARGNDVGRFLAEFYLARIYADSAGTFADQPKAFILFRKLADENADIDPDDDVRAPFVAKALIALASYVRSGVREIGVPPNPRRAANYLHHAAIFFGDKDAQFELAKHYLSAEGGNDDVRRGLHYLSTLSEQSYPAAQALLAELYWKGRHVKSDQRRALALITMAAENAPAADRIWIDETYHSIYCTTTHGTRQEATGIMARWRKMFARPVAEPYDRAGLGGRELLPERQCADGEAVAIRRATPMAGVAAAPPPTTPSVGPGEVMQGSALSLGFRPVAGPSPTAAAK